MTTRGRFTSPVTLHGFAAVDEAAGVVPDGVHLGRLRAVTVDLAEITVACQHAVDPARVQEYRDHPPRGGRVIVRPWDGALAVVDGHHTIAGARARGARRLRVRWMEDA